MTRLRAHWAQLLIVVVGGIAYSNTFGVPFLFDDNVVLLGEPTITNFAPSPLSRRFLGDLSFALSWRVFGAHPAGHHAVNLVIHVVNALLVWQIARLAWRTSRLSASPIARNADRAALLAALLFVSHPIQTQAVTYVVQRYASLAALFFLTSVCAYLKCRLASPGRPARGWYVLFLGSAAAACWTKENAFTLPLAIAAVEWSLFAAPLRRRAALLSPFLVAAGAALAFALASGLTLARLDQLARVDTSMARSDYLLTQLRVVARYLGLLALPIGQNLDHDVAISRSLAEPAVLLALALHALLVGGAVAALRWGSRRDPAWRLVGFGVTWFYVTLLVESSIIPIVDPMYEHRVYLPSVGLFIAVATALCALPPLQRRRGWAATAAALIALLTGMTFARNRVWRDDLSLWSDAASKSPRKARPLNNLGAARFARGEFASAAALYERAIQAEPGYTKAWFNLGEVRQRMGDCQGAIGPYEAFLQVHPAYPDTYGNLADCYDLLGRPDRARALRAELARLEAERSGRPLPTFYR